MTARNAGIVRRARALVGSRFRPQGRDPHTGLDCIGVILCAFGIPAGEVRSDYRLRGVNRREIEFGLLRHFRRVTNGDRRAGDVLLCPVSDDQIHLAIECDGSFVHADSRLRRVVETPGSPDWPIGGVFRLRARRARQS